MLDETIKSEFNMDEAINNSSYLAEFNDRWYDNLYGIASSLNYSKSVYVYFNSELFGEAQDTWLLRNEEGTFIQQEMFPISFFDGDTENKEWFYGPMSSHEPLWTSPYISENGDLITSYLRSIIKDNQAIALVGMDFNLSGFTNDLKSIELYKTGYLYMMDQNFNFIVHPSLEIGTNLGDYDSGSNVIDIMKKETSGNAIIDKSGIKIVSTFSRLDNGWIISSTIPLSEVAEAAHKILILILIITIMALILSIIIAIFVGRSISRPIRVVTKVIGEVKNGDFTVEAFVKSNDETKELADGLNEMILVTKNLINNTKLVSSSMSDASSTLASMAEETSATSDEVTRTVTEIAEGATEQVKDAESGTLKANDLEKNG